MNCACMNTSPGLRYVPNLMTDHYGRCKMCKGWRPNAELWLPLWDVLRQELPGAFRPDSMIPREAFQGIRLSGGGAERIGAGSRIHRDDLDRFVMQARASLRGQHA